MDDGWLESLGLACLVAIGLAMLAGLCVYGVVSGVAISLTPQDAAGIGFLVAASLFLPSVNEWLHLVLGIAFGASSHEGLRVGGLLLLGGAMTRLFGG
jgi:hypothetical protein